MSAATEKAHAKLVERAKEAAQAVHGDTTVSQDQTIESLRELIDEIEVMISAVEQDIARADAVEDDDEDLDENTDDDGIEFDLDDDEPAERAWRGDDDD